MKRAFTVVFTLLFVLVPATGAFANHIPNTPVPATGAALAVPIISNGPVRAVNNVGAAQAPAAPLGESKTFTRDGKTYMITSSMWYGLQVVDITNPLAPTVVSNYASAFGCANYAESLAAGNPDPLGVQGGWENDIAATDDGRIAIIGQDASGRCHDPAEGGIELVDTSDVTNPRNLHLVRNVGLAHSVTVDPAHPGLAWISTSDGADLIDIVDFRTCLGGVAKLADCKVTVSRVVFDEVFFPSLPVEGANNTDIVGQGCHDIRFRGERAYCAAIDTTLILDSSGVLGPDGELTGTHLTEGSEACSILPANAVRAAGVMITDCMGWSEAQFITENAKPADVKLVSFVAHDGSKPASEDISIAHQAEAIADGRIMIITDERGGGLTNTQGCPGGGVWFYDITDETKPKLMKQADGADAVYLPATNLPGTAHMSCTAHYGSEFADENILTFGWYLNGWRMLSYDVDFTTTPATVEFDELVSYIPLGGEVIQARPMVRNPNNPEEVVVYVADWLRGLDVFAVTAPRITRAAAFKTGSGTQVKAGRQDRGPLPKTGAGDPTTIALALIVSALFVSRRLRGAWR